LLAALVILLLSACGESPNVTYTVETIDNVKYIHNHGPSWGSQPKVTLRFVQKIGELENTDENYLLYRPNDVVVDSKGLIYISDMGNHRIQKYTTNGKYLATIGRKGQGPGEFSHYVRCMDICGDTLVINHTNFIIHKLSTGGKDLGRFKAAFAPQYLRHFSAGDLLTNHSVMLIGSGGQYTYNPSEVFLVRTFSKLDGVINKRFGSPILHENAQVTGELNNAFADTGPGDYVYVSLRYNNRLDKYSYTGKHIFSADRPLNFNESKEPEWVDVPSRKTSPLPCFSIVSRGIAVDGRERIWIITPNREIPSLNAARSDFPDDENLYDFHVFDKDGIFLGSIPAPVPWLEFKMRIFGNRLFLIEEHNEMTVLEYEITGG